MIHTIEIYGEVHFDVTMSIVERLLTLQPFMLEQKLQRF